MQKIGELENENDYLRKSLHANDYAGAHQPSVGGMWKNYGSEVPSSILRELEELKKENEMLRRDTISLLQKQSKY